MPVQKYDAMNLDANESIFFKRQLEHIMSKTFDVKYAVLKAMTLVPITTEVGPAATEITYRSWDKVGMAKMIADYATDFPSVDVFATEQTIKVKGMGASYRYSIEEIRRAQMAGVPLESKRASMAREAIERKHNEIILNGDTATGLRGFLNTSGYTQYVVPNGAGGTQPWTNKTSDEILADLNGITNCIVTATAGVEQPDTLLLPLSRYQLVSQKRLSNESEETVLSYFLRVNPYIKRVEWLNELETAGAGSTKMMMAYKNDSDHLVYHMPLPFEQYEADKKGMEYQIPCYSKTAGVVVYYPASCSYANNI
jgi:hypothetical protein